jgi:hypothetical protein
VGRKEGRIREVIRPDGLHITSSGKPTGKPLPNNRRCIMAFNTDKYTESPYLKGSDLEDGERLIVTIKSAEEVTFPSGDTVPVLGFLELDKKLTLNKTRIKKLVDLLGDDTDGWIDAKISLYSIDVNFQGTISQGVAVAAAPKAKSGKPLQPEVEFPSAKKGKPEVEEEEDAFA